jgi:hypothetical protein
MSSLQAPRRQVGAHARRWQAGGADSELEAAAAGAGSRACQWPPLEPQRPAAVKPGGMCPGPCWQACGPFAVALSQTRKSPARRPRDPHSRPAPAKSGSGGSLFHDSWDTPLGPKKREHGGSDPRFPSDVRASRWQLELQWTWNILCREYHASHRQAEAACGSYSGSERGSMLLRGALFDEAERERTEREREPDSEPKCKLCT